MKYNLDTIFPDLSTEAVRRLFKRFNEETDPDKLDELYHELMSDYHHAMAHHRDEDAANYYQMATEVFVRYKQVPKGNRAAVLHT